MYVELLTVGDELLLGLRPNTHLQFIGKRLADHGILLQHSSVVSDELQTLKQHIAETLQQADILIITGGLGPTEDDNTRQAVAEVLGLPLEQDPAIEKAIKARLKNRRKVPTAIWKQSYKPKDFEVLHNTRGTAPGLFYQKNHKIIILLPGPSGELYPIFENQVLPKLASLGLCSKEEIYMQLRTYGIKEVDLAALIDPVLMAYEGLGVSYCIHEGLVDVRLSQGCSKITSEELRGIGLRCAELIDEDFVCFGHATLAEVILNQLHLMRKSISVAESCSGGLLSYAFAQVPGASHNFKGSIVAYTNEIKEEFLNIPMDVIHQHDAVSEEVALAMATGAAECFSTDYALSITGYAGPQGGTEEIPIGTVFIGYHSPTGIWAKHFHSHGDRIEIQKHAVHAALDFMRRKLNEYKVADFLVTWTD